MSDNIKGLDRENQSKSSVFSRAMPLGPRNSRELALFFRIRRMTVVTMLVGSTMIIAAVCASLCLFALAMHNTITTDFSGVAQYFGLLAFGMVTVCALGFTATMISEAFRATSAIHAALSAPSLRAFIGGVPPTTTASAPQGAVIEHFWRAPCTVDTARTTKPCFTGPAADDPDQANCVEIQHTSAPSVEKNMEESSKGDVDADVPSNPSSEVCPSSASSQDASARAVAYS